MEITRKIIVLMAALVYIHLHIHIHLFNELGFVLKFLKFVKILVFLLFLSVPVNHVITGDVSLLPVKCA